MEIVGRLSFNNTELMVQAATAATTISSLVCLIYLYKYFILMKREVWKEVNTSYYYKEERIKTILKGILVVAIPITLSALFAGINKTIDALTIVRSLKGYYMEKEAIMKYGILTGKVETIISIPFSFNIAFSTALIPEISCAIACKEDKKSNISNINIGRKINFSILMSLLIGIIYTLSIELFSEQIITILFPNAIRGVDMLKIYALDIIPVLLLQTINGVLHGMGKTNITVIAFAVGGIVKIVLNLLLMSILRIGINGAIISTIISHLISFLICYIFLRKYIKDVLFFKKSESPTAKRVIKFKKNPFF